MENSKKYLKTAIIYIRSFNKESINTYSVESQEKLIKEFLSKNNCRILETFIDENLSGKSFNRPAFQEMVNYLKENKQKIKFLVVSDKTRLFSSNKNNLRKFNFTLKKYRIKPVYITEFMLKSKKRKREGFEF